MDVVQSVTTVIEAVTDVVSLNSEVAVKEEREGNLNEESLVNKETDPLLKCHKPTTRDKSEDTLPFTWCEVQDVPMIKEEQKEEVNEDEVDASPERLEVDSLEEIMDQQMDIGSGLTSETEGFTSTDDQTVSEDNQYTLTPDEPQLTTQTSSVRRTHVCSKCDGEFKGVRQLQKHSLIHCENPHVCQACGEQFADIQTFRTHYQTHRESLRSSNTPHMCSLCQKKFTRADNLAVHYRIHTGERPFLCNVCGKGFMVRLALNVHSRIHSGEKPYICNVCFKQFADRSNFRKHSRLHSSNVVNSS